MMNALNFADERLSRAEAAAYLGVSIPFLELDAVDHRHGVPFYKIGRKCFYRRSELDAWIAARRVSHEAVA
jgi:excisionase family DNA binding protein